MKIRLSLLKPVQANKALTTTAQPSTATIVGRMGFTSQPDIARRAISGGVGIATATAGAMSNTSTTVIG
jgi:hypothetical protein